MDGGQVGTDDLSCRPDCPLESIPIQFGGRSKPDYVICVCVSKLCKLYKLLDVLKFPSGLIKYPFVYLSIHLSTSRVRERA